MNLHLSQELALNIYYKGCPHFVSSYYISKPVKTMTLDKWDFSCPFKKTVADIFLF